MLDFDGVIVESVGIKDRAFRELYKSYPDNLDEIMAYHLANNATIRFEKFKHISQNILKTPYTPDEEERLSSLFSDLVFREIVSCPFVRGAIGFLDYYFDRLPLYLISMSPEDELQRILHERGLAHYFVDVYAAGWKKKDAIRTILEQEKVNSAHSVFIGDSYEDFQAAKSAQVHFIGRNSGKSFMNANIAVGQDMTDVGELLSGSDFRVIK